MNLHFCIFEVIVVLEKWRITLKCQEALTLCLQN
ncbi:hypothetical protein AAZX31_15G201600 [Glycine max]